MGTSLFTSAKRAVEKLDDADLSVDGDNDAHARSDPPRSLVGHGKTCSAG
jgi:hypothetical protein